MFTNSDGLSKLKVGNSQTLKNAFYRFQEVELKDINDQSVNLSGRSASPSEYRVLMEQLFKEEKIRKLKVNKKQEKLV